MFTGPGSYQGWVKAKPHEITAKQQDYLSEARRVTVAPGQLQDLELRLITLSEAADTGRRWAVWKPWMVVAAGGSVAVASGVLHTFSSRNFKTYDETFARLPCATVSDSKSPGCAKGQVPSDLNSRLSLATREQKISVGGYIAGGSLIATGVVLLYLNRPRLVEQPATNSHARSVAVVPTVSPDMLGILVSVSH